MVKNYFFLIAIALLLVSTVSFVSAAETQSSDFISSLWNQVKVMFSSLGLFSIQNEDYCALKSTDTYSIGGGGSKSFSISDFYKYEFSYDSLIYVGTYPGTSTCISQIGSLDKSETDWGPTTASFSTGSKECKQIVAEKYYCPDCSPANSEKCNGKYLQICSNSAWTSGAKTIGKCGVECTSDSDCGNDGYIGSVTCSGKNRVQTYRTFDCSSNECDYDDDVNTLETCTYDCTNGACVTQVCTEGQLRCNGNDVEKCQSNLWNNQGTCQYGCLNGVCNANPTCTEGNVILVNSVYQICHSGFYTPVTDLKLLTPAEQQEITDLINQLNASIQEKMDLIASLTTTLDEQITLLAQLQTTIAEKAIMINSLSLTISQQADLISQMELTVADQVTIIESLNLNIAQQAVMINQLTTNLAIKAALVEQLHAENEEQAALISQMLLSFADQAGIINQLNNTISDDAEIIAALNLNINDQAILINNLQLDNEHLAELVEELTDSLAEEAALIDALSLTISEQEDIIRALNLSLADEQELVNHLSLTIAEQQALLEQLQKEKETYDIRSIWQNYMIWIIAGGVIILLLMMRGKKK